LQLRRHGDPVVTVFAGSEQQFVLQGGGSGYHNYQVSYDATLGTADLFVDGMERLAGLPANSNLLLSPGYFFFGEGQGGGWANWNAISLSVVPEPSADSLILIGSGVLLYVRPNRKHCRR
jgi:hypothetical protein